MKKKLEKIINPVKSLLPKKEGLRKVFIKNFVAGIGWGIGATLGLSLIIALLTAILNRLGGLPIIGRLFAELIDVTNKALEIRKIR